MRTDYAGYDGSYRKKKAGGAAGWDTTEEGYAEFRDLVEAMLALPGVPASGRLLEIGWGARNMTVWLSRKGYEAWGVDIAPTAIEWARERAAAQNVAADFRLGNVLDLRDFADGFFDVVLDGHCLHCIIGQDRRKCLANVSRVLKPGGWFLIETMCRTDMPVTVPGFDPVSGVILCGDLATRYLGMPETIRAEIAGAGFDAQGLQVNVEDLARDGNAVLWGAAPKPPQSLTGGLTSGAGWVPVEPK